MGEQKQEAHTTSDTVASPSRRRALKAALAAAPIIMSLKSRPAFAKNEDQITPEQTSGTLSSNLSARPSARTT